jgi:uncharacterized membrane protein required for colicin V production
MVSLPFVFWMYVTLFAIVGAMRGWARELMVAFSVILALAFTRLLERYVPLIASMDPASSGLFWLRTIILVVLVFFGYQTVNLPRFAAKAARERLQDTLLGLFFGAINGYLIAGTLWFDLAQALYAPTGQAIIAPPAGPIADAVNKILPLLPPRLLGEPGIYFAVILAFIFVIVVFI